MTRLPSERSQRSDAHGSHLAAATPEPGRRALTDELSHGIHPSSAAHPPGRRALTDGLVPNAQPPVQRAATRPASAGASGRTLAELFGGPAQRASDASAAGDGSHLEAPPAIAPGRTDAQPTGAALPDPVRLRMEQSFGMDLSAVRVHEGPQARAQGALAYTQGADLHFAPGQYDPYSERWLTLLGHELAHVAQHAEGRAPRPQAKGERGGGDPALEAEADAMGARAAHGEAARPAGSPRLTATPDPGSAIQRMIDTDAPADGTPWDRIERYLEHTLVNQRKQTFKEAVEEFIATEVDGHDTVADAWKAINDLRGQDDQVNTALGHIRTIRTTINDHKSEVPDHPNRKGIDANAERYETIPQSAESKRIAFELRATLLGHLLGAFYTDTYYDHRQGKDVTKRKYMDPFTRDRKTIIGNWATSFMLGVLTLPDGSVQVAHSGFFGTTQSAAFRALITNAGYQVITHDDDDSYTALQASYQQALGRARLPAHHVATEDSYDNDKHKVIHQHHTHPGRKPVEKGNPSGVCAAPQAMHGLGLRGDFPKQMQGDVPLALTEVLVRADGEQGVSVNDASEDPVEYAGDVDVPSCLTCQHQLREVMKRLVDLRRNVVNRDSVLDEQKEPRALLGTVTELDEILKAADRVVGRVLGQDKHTETTTRTENVPGKQGRKKHGGRKTRQVTETREVVRDPKAKEVDAASERLAFKQAIARYQTQLERQALERTRHPEHVERSDRTGTLAGLGGAERRARAEHAGGLYQRHQTVGALIGFERYDALRGDDPKVQHLDRGAEELPDGSRQTHSPGTASELAKQASERRDPEQRIEIDREAAILDEAKRELAKIDFYREQGFLTARRARWFRKRLNGAVAQVNASYEALVKAKGGHNHPLHAALAKAWRDARTVTEHLQEHVARGRQHVEDRKRNEAGQAARASADRREREDQDPDPAAVHEQRAQELADDAKRASDKRGLAEQQRVRQEESQKRDDARLNREAARVDANAANRRHNQIEEDFSNQMWERAMSLAQIYDTAIERQLQYLLARDQQVNIVGPGVQPPPQNDHSSDYID